MPLQQTEITYNLGIGGVDQKTDPKFAQLGRPVELANARFPKTGQIAKRYGLVPSGASQINTIQRLFAIGEELLMFGYGGADGLRGWFSRTRSTPTDAEPRNAVIHQIGVVPPVPRAWVDNVSSRTSGIDLGAVDAAIGLTQTCYAYRRTGANGSRMTIVDNASGHVFYDAALTSGGAVTQLVRVLNIPGTNSFLVGAGGPSDTTLFVVLLYTNPDTGVVTTATDVSITLNANGAWDWALFGSSLIIARRTAAATTLTVTRFTVTSSTLSAPTNSSAITMTTGPDKLAIAVPYASTEDAVILAHDTTNGLRGLTVSTSTLAVVQALWVVNATLTVRNQITGCRLANGNLYTISELNNAAAYLISLQTTDGAIAATPTATTPNSSAYLGSKPLVTTASARPFWLAIHRDTTTDLNGAAHALFLMEDQYVVARFLRGDARDPPTSLSVGFVPQLCAAPSDGDLGSVVEYMVPVLRMTELVYGEADGAFGGPQLFKYSVLAAARFNVHPSKGYTAIRDGSTLLITGGFLASYDGREVIENGFLLPPEIISATASNGAGSLPVNGSFQIVACYARRDARGHIHRSAPSPVVAATTGAADDTIAIVVRALQFSQARNYDIEIYRTEDDGTIFYLEKLSATSVSSGTATVTINIGQSDANLIKCTPLGQQSAIMENDQPSCPIAIASNGRRVNCVSGADRLAVIEGKQRVKGEAVAFFTDIARRIPQDGDIVALENVGERWIALKRRSFFIASGEGADDTGQVDSLSEFEAHPTLGIGVSHGRELVQTPFGLIFRSSKGYYLIDSGGGVIPIGAGIDDYKDFPCVSAVFHADRNEVHFLLLDGPRLVLSIHETEGPPNFRWSLDEEDVRADTYCDIAVANGLLFAAPSNRLSTDSYEIFVEDIGGYADQGSSYPVVMRFKTGWIPITGRNQGRGRLYSAKFLGDSFGGPHSARVRAAYDYKDTWIDDKTITAANATAQGDQPYQWEFTPTKQKIQAVQFEFTEVLTEPTRGCAINQLMLTVGTQKGSKTVRRSQRAVAT